MDLTKVKVSKCTLTENLIFFFFKQTGLWEPNRLKRFQVFLQVLNPVNIAEILAPELVGGQSEMVVEKQFYAFFMLMW